MNGNTKWILVNPATATQNHKDKIYQVYGKEITKVQQHCSMSKNRHSSSLRRNTGKKKKKVEKPQKLEERHCLPFACLTCLLLYPFFVCGITCGKGYVQPHMIESRSSSSSSSFSPSYHHKAFKNSHMQNQQGKKMAFVFFPLLLGIYSMPK